MFNVKHISLGSVSIFLNYMVVGIKRGSLSSLGYKSHGASNLIKLHYSLVYWIFFCNSVPFKNA